MKLKELRNTNKISQQEMAKILNVTQTTYGRYELETSEPNLETLCKLADFYNVSLDYLVGREYKNDLGFLTPEQENIMFVIKKLNQKNLSTLLGNALRLLNEQ